MTHREANDIAIVGDLENLPRQGRFFPMVAPAFIAFTGTGLALALNEKRKALDKEAADAQGRERKAQIFICPGNRTVVAVGSGQILSKVLITFDGTNIALGTEDGCAATATVDEVITHIRGNGGRAITVTTCDGVEFKLGMTEAPKRRRRRSTTIIRASFISCATAPTDVFPRE